MTHVNDDELRALRKRAYGRDPDIHLDPASLARLRELESSRVEAQPAPDPVEDLIVIDDEPVDSAEPEARSAEQPPRPTPRLLVWLSSLRRSTVLIGIGIALVAGSLATALVLVQRVQTDPLQVGAQQVARLSIDAGYEAPGFFSGGENAGYQPFHGLRPVRSSTAMVYPSAPGSSCLTVFPEANVTIGANSFSGPLFGGCSAGAFPPIVQFSVDTEDMPSGLQSAFPESTSLQFVYDREHDEVVVFSDRR